MEKFVSIGKDIGLAGSELLEFVQNETEKFEKKENEARLREEEKFKQALVREEQREKEAREREERRENLELKRLEYEHARIEKEIELELEKMKSKPETKKTKPKVQIPKLPNFVENKDNIDSYLKRFERFATNASWPVEEWATNLSALLEGKALEVYSRLSAEDAVKYEVLRDSLLKRFQLTEEGFRSKLRNAKMEVGETAQQFVVRLDEYIRRWMNLAKVDETFDGLKDLILREQFMQSSNKYLQTFLKERKVTSVGEMADIADQYIEAHGTGPSQNKTPVQSKPQQYSNSYPVKPKPVHDRNDKSRQCYICKSPVHLAKECPQRFTSKQHFPKVGALESSSRGRYIGRNNMLGRGGHRGGLPRNFHGKSNSGSQTDGAEGGDVGCFVHENMHISDNSVCLGENHQMSSMSDGKKQSHLMNMPVTQGYMNDAEVSVLRDSGCSTVVVRRDLVHADCLTGEIQRCVLIDGTVRRFPMANIFVDTPYFTGSVKALCTERPIYDLILGNIEGVRDPGNLDATWSKHVSVESENSNLSKEQLNAVQTRAQKEREGKVKTLKVVESIGDVGVDKVKEEQSKDESLGKCREKARLGEKHESKSGAISLFVVSRGLLFRHFQCKTVENGKLFKQLCVPEPLRKQVMKLAHDSVMGGHLGIKKTSDKILSQFWWPGILADVKRYCQSCDICQKTFPKGKVHKVPIGDMPLIESPFERVAVDLIGPINPPSERGNRFILTLVDYATRYPEAVALKKIDSEAVAEALVEMFSRVGIPKEILSDMGKQFTSDLMKEVGRLLSVKQLTTTPYNPACNGLVEKFNGTLKSMIKKMCNEQPRLWDRYISPLLFAYREVPQASLGFSPFELLFGRTVRGPLAILKELWTKEISENEVKTTYQYVVDLRNRIEETLELARKELEVSSQKYRRYGNVGRKQKSIKVGDKVLVLLPTSNNKLLMHLQGPYEVSQKVNNFDYKVIVKGKEKIYHANLLKKYVDREQNMVSKNGNGNQSLEVDRIGMLEVVCVAVVEDENRDQNEVLEAGDDGETYTGYRYPWVSETQVDIELPRLQAKETIDDIHINPELSASKQKELRNLVQEFSDVFTDIPGHTNLIEHEIKLTSDIPVHSKAYPMPYAMRESFKKEIDEMLRLGIIEPIDSPYASPVVIVKKADNTNRVCIDYRKLNSITVFDSEPMANQDEIFSRLAEANYLSKIDLSKGYWQIKVKDECVPYTAFVCSEGLFAFKRMPFGMVNSGQTFCKMMRKLLKGLVDIDNFVDDIIDHTEGWEIHLQSLRELFQRLRDANLTARPSKCFLGYAKISFLGHVVGKGQIMPNPEKVETIRSCKRPRTKTQVRSFLGLVGYYRKFIPNFSVIAAVLTDMTKKGQPNEVRWSEEAETAFRSLINHISQSPILCLPELDKPFILRTDASEVGIGAVLMQETAGTKFPIAYASRKLLPREQKYSVMEKEGLGIVWGVQKFHQYLYGKEFILETDHAPLIYMHKSKLSNPRIMRWALALQPFRFRLVAIKGSENVGADFLSRLT